MARINRQQQPSENGENGHIKHSEGNGIETAEKKIAVNNTQFIERVTSIPLVKDGVSTAQALANKTYLGRFAVSKANETYNFASNYAANNQSLQNYYQNYAQTYVEKVDSLGCRSLDVIQEKVPIINQPTIDIYQNVVAKPSYQIIDGVKVRLDSTLATVTHPAHVVIRETNKRLGVVVDNLEGAVDKYLPSTAQDDANGQGTTKKPREATNGNQVIRVYGVFNEASRRITQRVTEGIPKSRDDLSRLADNNSIVQNVIQNIRLVQETLIASIEVYGNAAQEKLPASVTTRVHQATELFTNLTTTVNAQLSQLVQTVSAQSQQVPEWLKQKVSLVIASTQQQLASIQKELQRSDINRVEKLKHVADHLQGQILPLFDQIASQLTIYAQAAREKAQVELNVPLHYFGLNQKLKTQ